MVVLGILLHHKGPFVCFTIDTAHKDQEKLLLILTALILNCLEEIQSESKSQIQVSCTQDQLSCMSCGHLQDTKCSKIGKWIARRLCSTENGTICLVLTIVTAIPMQITNELNCHINKQMKKGQIRHVQYRQYIASTSRF